MIALIGYVDGSISSISISVSSIPEREHADLAVFHDGLADDVLDRLQVAHVVRVHDAARHLREGRDIRGW